MANEWSDHDDTASRFRIPNPTEPADMSVRTYSRRPARLALLLTLVGATALLAGCGDGAHMPAGSNAASMYGSSGGTGVGAIDSALGIDPGPTGPTGVTSAIDDPVLAGYDGVDSVGSLNGDDLWGRAANDWDESAGLATTALDDDPMLDDGFEPVGYGYGAGGYGDGWGSTLGTAGLYNSYGYGGAAGYGGYGNDLGVASLGGAGMYGAGDMYGNGGLIDDPTLGDIGFDDLGGSIDDPSIGIGAADTSLDDGGFDFNAGFSPVMDTGFDTGGFDPGIVDTGGFDTGGFDAGFDPGFGGADMGGFDPGVGAIDTGGFDTGGFDTGGFDAGVGGMDIGGMDAGIVF